MSSQTIRHQSPHTEELSAAPVDGETGRPHGHVVGHGPGELPAPSFAGRPRGHVVGHRLGGPPAPSFAGRPHGHVVGHRVDK